MSNQPIRPDLVQAIVDVMDRPAAVEQIRHRCTAAEFDALLELASALCDLALTRTNDARSAVLGLTMALAFCDEAYGKLRALIGHDARSAN